MMMPVLIAVLGITAVLALGVGLLLYNDRREHRRALISASDLDEER